MVKREVYSFDAFGTQNMYALMEKADFEYIIGMDGVKFREK